MAYPNWIEVLSQIGKDMRDVNKEEVVHRKRTRMAAKRQKMARRAQRAR